MERLTSTLLLGLAVLLTNCFAPERQEVQFDLVIHGGRVMDPETGFDSIINVGITDGMIAAISGDSLYSTQTIMAKGQVVAPGFINLNAHDFSEEHFRLMVRDGITTALQTEVGTADVSGWYKNLEGGQYINYGVGIGHAPVRMKVMGDTARYLPGGPARDLQANEEQLRQIYELIDKGFEEGAVAMGFGLAYTPAATNEEFMSALQYAAENDAFAYIHVRGTSSMNPDSTFSGLKEAISGAEKTGASIHIAHTNSSGGPFVSGFLKIIKEAQSRGLDVTTDAYPYEAGNSFIKSAIFNEWKSWPDEKFSTLEWPETGERLTRETFAKYRDIGGQITMHARTEEMTQKAIESELVMISNDGNINNGKGHPRISGSFTQVLGKYVREKEVILLMDALRKMTINPANRLESRIPSITYKGRLQVGKDADLVVFDANTVIDKATYSNPILQPEGMNYVIVNGKIVVYEGELQAEVKPGLPVRASISSNAN